MIYNNYNKIIICTKKDNFWFNLLGFVYLCPFFVSESK